MFSKLASNPHRKEEAVGADRTKHERKSRHRRQEQVKPGHPPEAQPTGGAARGWGRLSYPQASAAGLYGKVGGHKAGKQGSDCGLRRTLGPDKKLS